MRYFPKWQLGGNDYVWKLPRSTYFKLKLCCVHKISILFIPSSDWLICLVSAASCSVNSFVKCAKKIKSVQLFRWKNVIVSCLQEVAEVSSKVVLAWVTPIYVPCIWCTVFLNIFCVNEPEILLHISMVKSQMVILVCAEFQSINKNVNTVITQWMDFWPFTSKYSNNVFIYLVENQTFVCIWPLLRSV